MTLTDTELQRMAKTLQKKLCQCFADRREILSEDILTALRSVADAAIKLSDGLISDMMIERDALRDDNERLREAGNRLLTFIQVESEEGKLRRFFVLMSKEELLKLGNIINQPSKVYEQPNQVENPERNATRQAKLHNPDGLTLEHVEESDGWRLLDEDEVFNSDHNGLIEFQMWLRTAKVWSPRAAGSTGNFTYSLNRDFTYRTCLTRAELRTARGLPPELAKSNAYSNNLAFQLGKMQKDLIEVRQELESVKRERDIAGDLLEKAKAQRDTLRDSLSAERALRVKAEARLAEAMEDKARLDGLQVMDKVTMDFRAPGNIREHIDRVLAQIKAAAQPKQQLYIPADTQPIPYP